VVCRGHGLRCRGQESDHPCGFRGRQPIRVGRGRRQTPGPRHREQALPAPELLPARVLPGGAGAAAEATGWERAAGGTDLERQVVGVHAAVRGAGAAAVPADDVRCGGADRGRESTSGGCDLRALRGGGIGPDRSVGGTRGGDRRDLALARSRLHRPDGRCTGTSGAGGGAGALDRDGWRAGGRDREPGGEVGAGRLGQHRHVAGLHQGLRNPPPQCAGHVRQVPCGLARQRRGGQDAAHRAARRQVAQACAGCC